MRPAAESDLDVPPTANRSDWIAPTAVMLLYGLAAGFVCILLRGEAGYRAFAYAGLFLPWLIVGLVALVVVECVLAVRRSPAAPAQALVAGLGRWRLGHVAGGLALWFALVVFYGSFTSFKTLMPFIVPFHADAALAEVDRVVHAGRDPWIILQPLMGHPFLTRAVEFLYGPIWMLLLATVPVIVALHPDLAPVRGTFFLTFATAWVLGGTLIALAALSAGPAFYAAVTGDASRFAGLMAYRDTLPPSPFGSREVQTFLWQARVGGVIGMGTGISAFPSMHVATVTLWVILARTVCRPLLVPAIVFWAVVMAGSVHLAWHYAIDGYAAAALVAGLWALLARRRRWPAALAVAFGTGGTPQPAA